jgi:hypothetical protein
MLPLTDPRTSLREATKQLILLEDHLCHPAKRCPDCIRKHLLAAEAFGEEAVGLDPKGPYVGNARAVVSYAREWLMAFHDGVPCQEIAEDVRVVRKGLAAHFSDPRGQGAVQAPGKPGLRRVS